MPLCGIFTKCVQRLGLMPGWCVQAYSAEHWHWSRLASVSWLALLKLYTTL